MDVYPNNAPLKYGRHLGDVVDIQTKRQTDENKYSITASINESATHANVKLNAKGDHNLLFYSQHQTHVLNKGINKKAFEGIDGYDNHSVGLQYNLPITQNTKLNLYNYFNYGLDEYYFDGIKNDHLSNFKDNRSFHLLQITQSLGKSQLGLNGKYERKDQFSKADILNFQKQTQLTSLEFENIFGELFFQTNVQKLNIQTGVNIEKLSYRNIATIIIYTSNVASSGRMFINYKYNQFQPYLTLYYPFSSNLMVTGAVRYKNV